MGEVWEIFLRAWQYALSRQGELLGALRDHLALSGAALLIALAICVPLGIWAGRARRQSPAGAAGGGGRAALVMNAISGLRVVPSLAVLFLLVPWLGLGMGSALAALAMLALPPILLNTEAAFRALDPAVLESARGMGMTSRQMLLRVELPLALPVMLAGARTAAVEVLSSATLAAFVGSGGLGIYITRGFALYDFSILLVGAVPVALLTLTVEVALGRAERALVRQEPDRVKNVQARQAFGAP